MRRATLVAIVVAIVVAAGSGIAGAQGMLRSKHNLSVTGPGPVRAVSETQVCAFCHTPHNANPSAPLWNRDLPGQTYTPYASGSLQAVVGQPNGYSRLCLSCHDGTIAIGKINNLWGQPATITMQSTGANGVMPTGSTLLGTNLTNDHPISFAFSAALSAADGELVAPTALTGVVRLYEGATGGTRDSVQCTTCHDPHAIANPKFLRKPFVGRADNLCLTCHVKPGWVDSSHESATTKFFPIGATTSVADLSCGSCHTPHTKQGAVRLLAAGATDAGAAAIQLTCFRCHAPATDGGITYDIKSQFAKSHRHDVGVYPGHEPVFTTAAPVAESVLNRVQHVECPDCHNPHRLRARGTPGTGGVLEGMRGIALGGTIADDVTQDRNLFEYEVCLRCHGDTYGIVIGSTVLGDPTGTITTSNKRTEFQTTNSSFHPVGGPGHNASGALNAQLTGAGLSTSAVIKCTDCHNNNYYSGSSFRGVVSQYGQSITQPKGPHGSTNYNILRARFWNTLPGPSSWSSLNFDLCFQCHDVSRLTSRRTPEASTNFYDEANGKDNLHWVHLIDRIDKARPICKDCHYNIHSNVEATNTQYRVNGALYTPPTFPSISTTRLINFSPVVRPIGGRAKPEWSFNTATRQRQCFLQCHQTNGTPGGVTMNGLTYTPPSGGDTQ